jgi:hypothetical protein
MLSRIAPLRVGNEARLLYMIIIVRRRPSLPSLYGTVRDNILERRRAPLPSLDGAVRDNIIER